MIYGGSGEQILWGADWLVLNEESDSEDVWIVDGTAEAAEWTGSAEALAWMSAVMNRLVYEGRDVMIWDRADGVVVECRGAIYGSSAVEVEGSGSRVEADGGEPKDVEAGNLASESVTSGVDLIGTEVGGLGSAVELIEDWEQVAGLEWLGVNSDDEGVLDRFGLLNTDQEVKIVGPGESVDSVVRWIESVMNEVVSE